MWVHAPIEITLTYIIMIDTTYTNYVCKRCTYTITRAQIHARVNKKVYVCFQCLKKVQTTVVHTHVRVAAHICNIHAETRFIFINDLQLLTSGMHQDR